MHVRRLPTVGYMLLESSIVHQWRAFGVVCMQGRYSAAYLWLSEGQTCKRRSSAAQATPSTTPRTTPALRPLLHQVHLSLLTHFHTRTEMYTGHLQPPILALAPGSSRQHQQGCMQLRRQHHPACTSSALTFPHTNGAAEAARIHAAQHLRYDVPSS